MSAPKCEVCTDRVAYEGARFCGAVCTAIYEAKDYKSWIARLHEVASEHAKARESYALETEQLRAWKEHAINVAARQLALSAMPPLHIHTSHGRMPDDDVREDIFVPIESYNEVKGQANLSFGAVEALRREVEALRTSASTRITQLEEALRFYANPDNDDDGGQRAIDALMSRLTSPLHACLEEIARNAKTMLDGRLPHFTILDFAHAVHDRAKAALEGRYR